MIVCYNVYLYYCFVYTPLRMGLLWCFRFNGVRATLAVALCFGWKRMAGVWEKTPKYSFVIPVRNRKGLRLRNTLASLEAQRFPRPLYEIIVVDYGGKDSLEGWLKECAPQARYVRTDEPGVFNEARAKNIGIRQASGSYIISTNADIVFEKNFLLALDALFAVFPDRLALCMRCDLDKGVVENHGEKVVDELEALRRLDSTVQRSHWWVGDCQASKKENFEEIRGFNEDFVGWGRLDNDLRSRMEEAGKRAFWLNPFTFIAHQNHEQDLKTVRAQAESNDRVLAKKYPDFCRNLEGDWGQITP